MTLTEIIEAKTITSGEEPLLEAERMVASILMKESRSEIDLKDVADNIVHFYKNCELWEPDALGKGHGWFRNMWVHTHGRIPSKDGYFDLGWGIARGGQVCRMPDFPLLYPVGPAKAVEPLLTEVLDFVIKPVIVRILYFEISENKCGRVFETFIREKFQNEQIPSVLLIVYI